jgi:hypothetical protein
MSSLNKVLELCDKCIKEGELLLEAKTEEGSYHGISITSKVDFQTFHKWRYNCKVLLNMLQEKVTPWKGSFDNSQKSLALNAKKNMSILLSIKESIEGGYLVKVEKLVYAEAFINLIEQAEYLYDKSYYLASGVLCRAVLEEKLRNLIYFFEIEIDKDKPTLNDFNIALYKAEFYNKIEMKNIDHLISMGNHAAHNVQPSLTKDETKSLLKGVMNILRKYD